MWGRGPGQPTQDVWCFGGPSGSGCPGPSRPRAIRDFRRYAHSEPALPLEQVKRSSMEAPHNARTGRGHAPPPFLEVRKRLERRTLRAPPRQVRVGKAAGEHTCVVCERVIRRGMIQNEFSADGGGTAFVHTLCL